MLRRSYRSGAGYSSADGVGAPKGLLRTPDMPQPDPDGLNKPQEHAMSVSDAAALMATLNPPTTIEIDNKKEAQMPNIGGSFSPDQNRSRWLSQRFQSWKRKLCSVPDNRWPLLSRHECDMGRRISHSAAGSSLMHRRSSARLFWSAGRS